MSSQDERLPSSGPSRHPPIQDKVQAFGEMYDDHAAHVFDYCRGIVGNRHLAAQATQATFVAAQTLSDHLHDPDRLRPWLMSLARRECHDSPSQRAVARASAGHARRELAEALAFIDAADDDVDDDDSDDLTGPDLDEAGTVRAALQKLSTEQREILNLVYRYGIGTYELPAILGIDAAGVAELLTDAEIRFAEGIRLLDQTSQRAGAAGDRTADTGSLTYEGGDRTDDNGWTDVAEGWTDEGEGWTDGTGWIAQGEASKARRWLTVVPLDTLPASIWRRTSRGVIDPKFKSYREALLTHAEHLGPDGFPIPTEDPVSPPFRRLLGVSALLVGLLLAPVGLGWAGYAEFSSVAAISGAPTPSTSATSAPGSPAPPSPAGSGSQSGRPKPASKPSAKHTSKAPGHPAGGAPLPNPSKSGRPHKPKPSPKPTSRYSSPTSPPPSPSKSPTSSPSPSPSPSPTPADQHS